jgi:hypothetical protein
MRYQIEIRMSQATADALLTSVEKEDVLELTYITNDFRFKGHTIEFLTHEPLATPAPPTDVTAVIIPHLSTITEDGLQDKSLAKRLWQDQGRRPAGKGFFPLHSRAIAVCWDPPHSNDKHIRRYLVQRLVRHPTLPSPPPAEWLHVYKGPQPACIDVMRQSDLLTLVKDLRGRGGDGADEAVETADWSFVEVLYRVAVANDFGWSGFSKPGRVRFPCGEMDLGVARWEDPGDLHLDPSEFPPSLFGLDEEQIKRPEHFERQIRLPNISRKYRAPLAKQLPALTRGVWHTALPIDAKKLAERRERLMKYRSKMADMGQR